MLLLTFSAHEPTARKLGTAATPPPPPRCLLAGGGSNPTAPVQAPSAVLKRATMVLTNFNGAGVGFGFGVGCGFGVGWGFGGMPLNFLGLGAGGGCGVGLGLGWGFGTAFGCHYRSSTIQLQGIDFSSKDQGADKECKDLTK